MKKKSNESNREGYVTSRLCCKRKIDIQLVPYPPILGQRNSRSLRAILMPSLMPNPHDAHTGSFKFQRPRCITCQQHIWWKGQLSPVNKPLKHSTFHTISIAQHPMPYTFYTATNALALSMLEKHAAHSDNASTYTTPTSKPTKTCALSSRNTLSNTTTH